MTTGAYFDLGTLFLYVCVGVLGSYFISKFKTKPSLSLHHADSSITLRQPHSTRARAADSSCRRRRGPAERKQCRSREKDPRASGLYKGQSNEQVYAFFFFFLYVFLAVFRQVGYEIGGTDAPNYIDNFKSIIQYGGIDRRGNVELESGFQLITRIVRFVTDEYRVYFFVCYGIITYGYIRFIRVACPRGGCYIPFLLIMYPFFRGFNTMRTSLAIAFVLLGLSYLNKKKWLSLALLVFSVFVHRISIIFVMVWPYYVLLHKPLEKLSRKRFALVSLLGAVLTFTIASFLRNYIVLLGLIDSSDMSYIYAALNDSFISRWPLYLGPLLLFIAIVLLYDRIRWNRQTVFLRSLFVFDIWMVPVAIILGMWRFVEYFYLVRLSLWSVVIPILMGRKSYSNVMIVKSAALVAFVAWFAIRFFKEWDATMVSPYIFELF